MPIFISRNHKGLIESVVLAKNYELANAYWQGTGIMGASIDVKQESDLDDHPTGVLPIVKTKKINASPFGQNSKEYLVISND